MDAKELIITPQTKVGELLTSYPALEDVLISVVPVFKKLRNPVLRKTVARVTTLAQAARVGGVPVGQLVKQLREAVGQSGSYVADEAILIDEPAAEIPAWFDPQNISTTLDARQLIDSGEQPLGRVMSELERLPSAAIFELVTPFAPAPLIDQAVKKGFLSFTRQEQESVFRTYFKRE